MSRFSHNFASFSAISILLVAAAAQAAVLPSSIPDLYAWYKADALSLGSGADVNTWVDSSGNAAGLDMIAMIASDRPVGTYNPSGINGKPTVTFTFTGTGTGTGSGVPVGTTYQSANYFNALTGDPAYTVFIVARHDPVSTTQLSHFIQFGGASAVSAVASQTLELQRTSGTNYRIENAGGWSNDYQSTYIDPSDTNLLISMHKTPGPMNTTNTIKVDGTAYGASASTTLTPAIPTDTHGWLGASPFIGGSSFNGELAEVIFFSRALTSEEENDIGWYLQDKYGLTGAYTAPPNNTPNVPEPSSLALAGLGLASILFWGRKRIGERR